MTIERRINYEGAVTQAEELEPQKWYDIDIISEPGTVSPKIIFVASGDELVYTDVLDVISETEFRKNSPVVVSGKTLVREQINAANLKSDLGNGYSAQISWCEKPTPNRRLLIAK